MQAGMTLIELLVVIVIIGILGAVSLRAVDLIRERTNYDKTMRAMEHLANAIAGNPDLVADGRRTDFGFVGDLGRMPTSLEELRRNLNNNPAWNGPYVRIPFTGDSLSFKTDAWGQEFQYLSDRGMIISLANGRLPLTYQVTADTYFLFDNSVSGTVTDNQGNPPGDQAPTVHVHFWFTDRLTGQPSHYDTVVGADGSYAFSPPGRAVAVGNHLITAVWGNDSVSKWVAVEPRVGAVVNLPFGNARVGLLRLVTQSAVALPGMDGVTTNNVRFQVINTGTDSLALDNIQFYHSDPNAWCESLLVARLPQWDWINEGYGSRAGGDSSHMGFQVQDTVAGGGLLLVELHEFMTTQISPPDTAKDMRGDTLRLRFSDGSFVSLVPY
jgi:prepilin-type N-terminal cleavage/methylation domain-containing protein